MGRRRKSQDAGGGFLLLLALVAVAILFIVRLSITLLVYLIVPGLCIVWIVTNKPSRKLNIGDPHQFDDSVIWDKINSLRSERQRLFEVLRAHYDKGFKNGLTVTAKSENRLFHAG